MGLSRVGAETEQTGTKTELQSVPVAKGPVGAQPRRNPELAGESGTGTAELGCRRRSRATAEAGPVKGWHTPLMRRPMLTLPPVDFSCVRIGAPFFGVGRG
jgi:hypothetical protein